jgi:hypothetical protein
MSMIVRDGDIDLELLKARVHPKDAQEALRLVDEAINKLDALAEKRGADEPAHEILRALSMVRWALEDSTGG